MHNSTFDQDGDLQSQKCLEMLLQVRVPEDLSENDILTKLVRDFCRVSSTLRLHIWTASHISAAILYLFLKYPSRHRDDGVTIEQRAFLYAPSLILFIQIKLLGTIAYV